MLVYRDESHVSTPYSAWLAPMMAPFFESTAQRPAPGSGDLP
jgi:hypothetical protein